MNFIYITCVQLQTRLMPLIIRVRGTEEEEEWVMWCLGNTSSNLKEFKSLYKMRSLRSRTHTHNTCRINYGRILPSGQLESCSLRSPPERHTLSPCDQAQRTQYTQTEEFVTSAEDTFTKKPGRKSKSPLHFIRTSENLSD